MEKEETENAVSLKQPLKISQGVKNLVFFPLGISQITLLHRPSKAALQQIQAYHQLTMVVTLLNEAENPQEIAQVCEELGVKWVHIPIKGAQLALLSSSAVRKVIVEGVLRLYAMTLQSEENFLVHCAHGLHRTGIVAYLLFRMHGFAQYEALESIRLIREETYQGVGGQRIKYIEEQALPILLKKRRQGFLSGVKHEDKLETPPIEELKAKGPPTQEASPLGNEEVKEEEEEEKTQTKS